MATHTTRRSGSPVDAGVALSDILRDPRERDTLDDDGVAREIRGRWQSCLDSSRDLRLRQWPRNVLMTYGDGDVRWSDRADRWLTVPLLRPRRYKTPLLPGRVAYMAARMTQSAPEWTAIPAGDGIEQEEAAKFCEKLLRYSYREQRIDIARYFAVVQMCLFGFGINELYLDDEANIECVYEIEEVDGKAVLDPETGMPVYRLDRKGRPRVAECITHPGIKTRPVSPFAFAVPPGLEWPLLADSPYCIRASWLSEAYIRRRYDVSNDTVLVSDDYGGYEAMNSYLWQAMNPATAPQTRFEAGRILVLQYYEMAKDVKGYYEGKVYTVCGNRLIGDEPSLFDDGRYPFFMFPWMPVTDSFYSFPWLNPQIDPQNRLDQTVTHLMDHVARVGSPNIIYDRGSGFPPDASFAYNIYSTTPGLRRPEFMQAPAMPTGAYEMKREAMSDMDAAGMMYPLARGQSTQGITSGLHARAIQDADQTEMGPVVRMHASEFARMGESILELYREHGGDDRMLAMVGDGGEPELFAFKKSSIPIGQRVYVQEESLLVHYRSALEERAVAMGGAGAFGNLAADPRAQEKFRRAVRDPHLAGPLTPEEVQKQFIDEVHFRIIHKNEKIPIEAWWDLSAHRMAAHERLCRESLRWDDSTKARFMDYWNSIEEAVAKVEEEQMQSAIETAEKNIELEGKSADVQANAKAKIELLRGVNKLAVKSMETPEMGAGAGARAAALGFGAEETEGGDEENAAPKKGAA